MAQAMVELAMTPPGDDAAARDRVFTPTQLIERESVAPLNTRASRARPESAAR
jgi:hypothetical protein